MQIKFSRHAIRRGDLYNIAQSAIRAILEGTLLHPGIHEIVRNVEGSKYPLKVVVAVENDIVTVITNYPLKKGRKP